MRAGKCFSICDQSAKAAAAPGRAAYNSRLPDTEQGEEASSGSEASGSSMLRAHDGRM
jgi:hypothetical protein